MRTRFLDVAEALKNQTLVQECVGVRLYDQEGREMTIEDLPSIAPIFALGNPTQGFAFYRSLMAFSEGYHFYISAPRLEEVLGIDPTLDFFGAFQALFSPELAKEDIEYFFRFEGLKKRVILADLDQAKDKLRLIHLLEDQDCLWSDLGLPILQLIFISEDPQDFSLLRAGPKFCKLGDL